MPISEMPAFSPENVALILQALDGLKDAIQRARKTTVDLATRNNADKTLDTVLATSAKLKKRSTEFTLEETKTIYTALAEWRESINTVLDAMPASNDKRPALQDALRSANRLIRRLKEWFRELEIDGDAVLTSGRESV